MQITDKTINFILVIIIIIVLKQYLTFKILFQSPSLKRKKDPGTWVSFYIILVPSTNFQLIPD